MTGPELLKRFEKVTVWNRAGVRAPHKPLLLLWALGRVVDRKPRLCAFSTAEKPLRRLLVNFGPRRKSYHPEYPFWYLRSKRNSAIWEVEHAQELPRKKNCREPKIANFRQVKGGFLPEVQLCLETDRLLVEQVVVELLNANFPSSMHHDIRDAVGLHSTAAANNEVLQDGDFSSVVIEAYENRCAVCGYQPSPEQKHALEVAHIKWQQAGGPDEVANGLCLCVMHRKAFDRGMLGISERGTVVVAEQARRSKGLDSWLASYENQPVAKPKGATWEPNPSFVAWHMREVFQGSKEGSGRRPGEMKTWK